MTKQYKVVWVDPPEGWRYGFPKNVDDSYHNMGVDKTQWYIDNGYPEKLKSWIKYSRAGLEEINED